ncbi:hypothetical protein SO802_022105 [Lithocarpus litseifolius]|uniref:Uncharacterized protein n=1 Tax=Lithocarpus litseifolius TaxID=425828 RepID=A0AAW2CGR3_9ROSI
MDYGFCRGDRMSSIHLEGCGFPSTLTAPHLWGGGNQSTQGAVHNPGSVRQNPPPLAAPSGFGTWKTLPIIAPDTCGGALRWAARCGEGRFHWWRAVAEQAYSDSE